MTSAERTSASRWPAVRARPKHILASTWPLRALAYVVSGAAVGLVTLVWLPVALVLGAIVLTPALTHPLAALERRRLALLDSRPLPDPHRRPDRPGPAAWLRSRYAEPATWRELAYALLHATVLLVLDLVAVALLFAPILMIGAFQFAGSWPGTDASGPGPGGDPVTGTDVAILVLVGVLTALVLLVVGFVVIIYAVPLAAVAHGELARLLLAPGRDETIREVTRSRARLVDAFEIERRRIERDLHDGAQQRLLELGMTLVAAQLELDDDPRAAKPLVALAADQARSALTELRELIYGIHPQVLTDLGLPAAVAELADRSPLPVTVTLDLAHRLPSAVESAAYFVTAEALTNAARHAHATQIVVTGDVVDSVLRVEVRDDGVGGADPGNGTGLTGLADRADVLGGTLTLSSPCGGPTTLTLELPCSG